MDTTYIISHYQTDHLLTAHTQGKVQVATSLDLGLTTTQVALSDSGISLSVNQLLTWTQIKKISHHPNQCFLLSQNQIQPVVLFSNTTHWVRSLYPTPSAPTTIVGGFFMHQIKHANPLSDTKHKVKTLGNINQAIILDTATGLGYSAIAMSTHAQHIESVEIDPTAIDLAKLNPWSRPLFSNPAINLQIADINQAIIKFPDHFFTHIFHDPPTFKLAGQLYSLQFYRQLHRVLKPKGKLFHYIGDPNSRHGNSLFTSVTNRLQQAGFAYITPQISAFGLTAINT